MAEYLDKLQGLFGAAKSSASSAVPSDADFADFAGAASPSAVNHGVSSAFSGTKPTQSSSAYMENVVAGRPFTKWYRVWERVELKDFYQELVIIPVLFIMILVNIWGTRANRSKARKWMAVHAPILESEFASVGFRGGRSSPNAGDVQSESLADATASSANVPTDLLKETSKSEYISYATGRQNTAWLDLKITLLKRYNPIMWLGDYVLGFFFDSMPPPVERVEATAYCFDGKEKSLVPQTGEKTPGNKDSNYDGFVWALVHKDKMKQLRDDRYDLSLTSTKDHAKLPDWATVMSESAEVTEVMLTPELIKAVQECDESLEALVVTDQPIDAPNKLNDTIPRKRVSLSMKMDSSSLTTASSLFVYFLRLPDYLVNTAHFRPEALRRIKATRDEEMKKLKKASEDEKSEERKTAADKLKKEERERKLSGLSASEQKKFLEKEREKERSKGTKRKTMKA